MKPLVSVMMLTYNQASFVREAVESVVSQDYDNFHLVIADDASDDDTLTILKKFRDLMPQKITLLHNSRNLGITNNSNIALKHCYGEYIAMAYGDDIMLPGKLSAQVDWFLAHKNAVLCGHDVEIFSSDTGEVITTTHCCSKKYSDADKFIRDGGLFPTTSVMFKRAAAPAGGFDDRIPFCSDYLFLAMLLAGSTGYCGKVAGVFARYRRHDLNASKSIEKCLVDIESSLRILEEKYPEYTSACRYARFQHIDYQRAINYVAESRYALAYKCFVTLLKQNPLKFKLYLRILQLPLVAILSHWNPQTRKFFFPHIKL